MSERSDPPPVVPTPPDAAAGKFDEPSASPSPAAGEPSAGGADSIADGRERKLDPRALPAARLAGGIAAAIVGAISVVGLILVLLAARPTFLVAWLLVGGWLLINAWFVGMGLIWPGVRHRRISYRVDPRGIRIRRGVIWRSEITVPRSRVQHTDVSRGPIERSFGLATLILHTAGTEHAAVSLGGLAVDVASRIRNFLIEGGEDDAV